MPFDQKTGALEERYFLAAHRVFRIEAEAEDDVVYEAHTKIYEFSEGKFIDKAEAKNVLINSLPYCIMVLLRRKEKFIMPDGKIFIKYRAGGKIYTDDLYQTEHYFIEDNSTEDSLKIAISPREKIELLAFEVKFGRVFDRDDRFFSNGYQSWTSSREYVKGDKYRGLISLIKLFPYLKPLASISGDYNFYPYPKKTGVFGSHVYTYIRSGEKLEFWGSLSERKGYTVFTADMNENTFTVAKDVQGLTIDEPYELFNIVKFVGCYDEVFDKYFDAMGIKKPKINHLSGYTSWYNYFQKIDENIILRDLAGIGRAKEKISIFQIDDGYETFVGDWLDLNQKKFPNGMKNIAEKIHAEGYLAGIWLAPFNVQRKSRTAKEHPDWLLKYPNGRPYWGCAGWGGAYTLDIYNPEVRAHIKNFFNVILNDWGYDMVKLDFLYSECMYPRQNKTRGQIMCEAMEFLRECVGDKLILGCGVPLGPAFGYVDACRISCDVDKSYKPKFYSKINRETPSAQSAIINSVSRRHLNGRAFVSDPDVFFLRDFNLKYSWNQKVTLAKVNKLFGDVLFVSDDVGKYGEKELEVLKETFTGSEAQILSAEVSPTDHLNVEYMEDGVKKIFRGDILTGETETIVPPIKSEK